MSLDVGLVAKGGFTEGVSKGASAVLQAVKSAAVWTGRMIKVGFEKLGDLIKYCWNNSLPLLKDLFHQTAHFLRTAPGLGLVAGALGVALGATAEGVKDQKWVALALRISAAVAFLATGVAAGLGLAVGFSTPLI